MTGWIWWVMWRKRSWPVLRWCLGICLEEQVPIQRECISRIPVHISVIIYFEWLGRHPRSLDFLVMTCFVFSTREKKIASQKCCTFLCSRLTFWTSVWFRKHNCSECGICRLATGMFMVLTHRFSRRHSCGFLRCDAAYLTETVPCSSGEVRFRKNKRTTSVFAWRHGRNERIRNQCWF
jgi:hypothetical protein